MEKLYKRTALGIYTIEFSLVTISKNMQVISSSYGLYHGSKIHYQVNGDEKKYIALIKKKKQEGYKSCSDLGFPNKELTYSELLSYLPIYNTDENNCFKPMKCQPFVAEKFDYGFGTTYAIGQPKINGNRSTIMYGMSNEGLFSKNRVLIKSHEGIVLNIKHVQEVFDKLFQKIPKDTVFDGEMYVYGEPVTSISGACKNPNNPIHHRLGYHSFDLSIPDVDQLTRIKMKHDYLSSIMFPGICEKQIHPSDHKRISNSIVVDVCDTPIHNDAEAAEYRDLCIEQGYEGCVIRNPTALYKFGSRPMTMMKLKKPKYGYFEVIDIVWYGENKDNKVGIGCKFVLRNDLNSLLFESNPIGTVEEKRKYFDNRKSYIGTKVLVKYYERTINKLPFHHNVIFNESNES